MEPRPEGGQCRRPPIRTPATRSRLARGFRSSHLLGASETGPRLAKQSWTGPSNLNASIPGSPSCFFALFTHCCRFFFPGLECIGKKQLAIQVGCNNPKLWYVHTLFMGSLRVQVEAKSSSVYINRSGYGGFGTETLAGSSQSRCLLVSFK